MKIKRNGTQFSPLFIMAHGAGAPMDSDWMNDLTEILVAREIQVIRFEFPYMEERRHSGTKRPPNAKKILLETWKEVIAKVRNEHPDSPLYIGGKSMGGRMASLVADEEGVTGLIALGFPFHAPGKGPKDRIDHLLTLECPTLIVQGTRDTMGSKEECDSYPLSKKIQFHWLEDGDHSWKPRKKSGHTLAEHMQEAADMIAQFIRKK